ncbi:segregation and condensation protein A [Halothermothrix orenii]|uniref:Segregation and condensation protein A n=1 Tax=Halothermothrix orenii (strain H 168 / OCM 544 / DSM 9562) TaxID=373903 RepID=SCPA_HALOH|nr:segregation/condensation protein A [Halothermothrix orenii]B8CW05.1 RecName: Full=Segregation and condensation protein A [Halothermothrix orenii H 168]ACL69474.1 chromosome segregation and condensation protein ScpA [Halothermothrix orenii H 168]
MYEVQLDKFQGPLELLYQLVKKNKIEISEISLARITEQYLEYIEHYRDFNLEMASEFMVIASELIELKVKSLLPDSEEDSTEEEKGKTIVQRLKDYHVFKKVTELFREYEKAAGQIYSKPVNLDKYVDNEVNYEIDIDISELVEAFKKAMSSTDGVEVFEGDRNLKKIESEEIKIQDKMDQILELFNQNPDQGLTFSQLVSGNPSKMEIVVTFLSILELTKLRKIEIKQEKLFSDINLRSKAG